MNHTDYITQALIDDENMSTDLAALYPSASKIADAASTFIDKADQTIAKKNLAGQKAEIVAKCIDICQHVVKEGAAISRLLRNPAGSMQRLRETREPEGPVQPDTDEIIAEIVGEIEAAHNADETNENGGEE
mgnify:FL=1